MAALLPARPVLRCVDALEGTARGAWMLAHWPSPIAAADSDDTLHAVRCDDERLARDLRAHAQAWRARVAPD
jgi:hypothetical protein